MAARRKGQSYSAIHVGASINGETKKTPWSMSVRHGVLPTPKTYGEDSGQRSFVFLEHRFSQASAEGTCKRTDACSNMVSRRQKS